MKKSIYSVVLALVLSVFFILLAPQWFFKGDARWTYQNEAVRVDVSFRGQLKNGRVEAEGSDLQVTQSARLPNANYQRTIIEFPVSYRRRAYQIRLTPQAEEIGRDASLVIELKGSDFQHRGQRRPAWVTLQNIAVNGQSVADKKKVWHDKPFILTYPLGASELTLTFDVHKPFKAATDFSFVRFSVLFLAFLMSFLFFTRIKSVACRAAKFLVEKDVAKALSASYHRIDPVYRRSFWIIFGVLCFAFGFHTICFMWGNHDWELMDSIHRWNEHAWEGRYMLFSVKALLSNGVYLPLVHDTISFITLALNAVLLCKYWCLEKRVIYYVLCGLVLTAQPFTLSMIYFVNMTPEVFLGVTCTLVALLLSEKVAMVEVSAVKKILYSIIAIILINFSPAMYPVLINTIAVAFAGRLLVQLFDWDGSWQQLKSYIGLIMVSAINIVLGIALYKVMVTYVFPLVSFYNTDTIPLELVPERLRILLKQSFRQLFEYNMPFLSQWTLWIFLGFTILLTLYICFVGNFKQKVARLTLLFASLFTTQTAMIIAKMHLIDGRVELFGLVFFEVLVMTLVITRFKRLHNLLVIAGSCIVFTSVCNDLDCLRVWKLGFDAEKMLWNRVLARLEIQNDFDPAKKYEIVLVGNSISIRSHYYTKLGRTDMCGDLYTLHCAYDFSNNPLSAPEFYYPMRFRCSWYSTAMAHLSVQTKKKYETRLKRLYEAGVLQKAGVWPKSNGLIVWKDIILFVTDENELNNCREKFERELGKK